MGRPVASARLLPTAPVPPESDRLPSTMAVNGLPERKVNPPLRDQPRSSRAVHPWAVTVPGPSPMGEVST